MGKTDAPPGKGMNRFRETIMRGRFGDTLDNNMNKTVTLKPTLVVSVVLTLVGILIGLSLSLLAIWADYESTSYGFIKRANAPLRGLSCPMFLGRTETGQITIRVSNSTGQPLSPSIRTEISTAQDPVSEIEFIQLGPGQQATFQKTIGPENVDLGSFIFVSAATFSMYPSPDRESTCGIFVLPVATASSWISVLGAAVSMFLMSAGSFALYRADSRKNRSRALLFMVSATALAMFLCFLGWWVQPLLLIIMVVLTFLISLGSLFQ